MFNVSTPSIVPAIALALSLFSTSLSSKALAAEGKATLPPVKGKVILTISGKISNTNKDKSAQFDLAGLESLGLEKFSTMTPWYKTKVEFEGVSLKKVLDLVAAKGETLDLTALNDYTVKMPFDDSQKEPLIIAIKRDGKYMPVSDKGPLFVVYNFDAKKELQQKMYYSRSAWQLSKIEVK